MFSRLMFFGGTYLPLLQRDFDGDNSGGENPGAETLQRQSPTTFSQVDESTAASLPYEELRRLAREEARNYNPDASTATSSDSGESDSDDADAGVASTAEGKAGTRNESSPRGDTTGQQGSNRPRPATVEEALRQLDSVRGNLNTVAEERQRLQQEIQTLRQEQQRRDAEAQQAELRRQHTEAQQRIQQLPEQQRDIANFQYMNQVNQSALNDYARYLQQQQQEVNQSRLSQAKQQLPGMLEEIATYVATTNEVPADALLAYVRHDNIKQLIGAANTDDGLTAVAASIGELLDVQAKTLAGQRAADKQRRREAAIAGQRVQRDVPSGVSPAGGDVDEVTRINNMSPADFLAYKKAQLRANR